MTDHDALVTAVLADPDDDTARLVYADFIEESGEVERAAFIRSQIELAKCEPYDAFAITCPDDSRTGQPWRDTLPWADTWSPAQPFHRGFGYSIKTHRLQALLDFGDALFASAPIGELHLPGGSMDEYREFAEQPWLARVKSVRFWTSETPTEAVRALSSSPYASAVETVHFGKASSPGMMYLLEGLLASPIGRRLRELRLHAANAIDPEFFEPFVETPPQRLQRLTLSNVSISQNAIEQLDSSTMLNSLRELTIHTATINDQTLSLWLAFPRMRQLQCLSLQYLAFRDDPDIAERSLWFPHGIPIPTLKLLDLSGCYGLRFEATTIVASLPALRVLRLSHMRLTDHGVEVLVTLPTWNHLVELRLDQNEFTARAAHALMSVSPPPNLVRLVLDREFVEQFPALRERYGDALATH